MANNLKLSNAAAAAEANALGTLANSGYIRIYDGTQPATADTAITTQTLLAELTFGNPAFGTSTDGVLTANSIGADTSANNSGTATWFRVFASNGTTVLWDGSVGVATADLVLNSVTIGAGATVSITSLQHTVPKS